ncbi:hypothetical protein JHE00_30360 [Prauserella sp. ASG 168]|uniref:Uncharacterized protein n=2 Tax=Prauserella cavernicola TaxID=2800127 RepID=A0A934V4R8_9PSEU|nr:hypothetical protein [Prauserella cavernicola]
MPAGWAWDAVQAEVAYRQEELRKSGRGGRARGRRWGRRGTTEVRIPEQRVTEHDAERATSLPRPS